MKVANFFKVLIVNSGEVLAHEDLDTIIEMFNAIKEKAENELGEEITDMYFGNACNPAIEVESGKCYVIINGKFHLMDINIHGYIYLCRED